MYRCGIDWAVLKLDFHLDFGRLGFNIFKPLFLFFSMRATGR